VYIATSFFGFLLFGDHTLDDLLANFDGEIYGSLLNDVMRVSYVIPLMLVFPIVLFTLRLNIDGLFFPIQFLLPMIIAYSFQSQQLSSVSYFWEQIVYLTSGMPFSLLAPRILSLLV
uniref:Amino acid transporter transmembrane domain-containing protein n=1 Tax=Solanum lycopersicum TaxID=4081 RepID=A0A3Q7I4L2_SOLLC